MALIFHDSFDHFVTALVGAKTWSFAEIGASPGDRGVTIGAYGRNSTNGLRSRLVWDGGTHHPTADLVFASSGTTAIVGFAFKVNSALPAVEIAVCALWFSGVQNISVTMDTSGYLKVRRGDYSGTVLGTASTPISHSVFYFLELKVVFHDTTGTWELRVDSVNKTSGTGADTIASGTAGFNRLQIGLRHASGENRSADFDDVYVCDGSGGSENDFLGDHRTFMQLPSTGNGTHTDFTPSTGSDHGALVDEVSPGSDYVESGTVGHQDSFNYAALGITGTVKCVTQPIYARAAVGGVRNLAAIVRIGGTTYVHATPQVLGGDYAFYRFTWLLNPATAAAWTVSDIDGAEFGAKVYS